MITLAKAHFHFLKLDRYGVDSDVVIIRIMLSLSSSLKVIPLSGFHCIWLMLSDLQRPEDIFSSSAVFPKVRSTDHFGSVGIFNLVRESKNKTYFKLFYHKNGLLWRKICYLMVHWNFLEILWSAKLFFHIFPYCPQAKKVWETLI
jgi:hypothetical protein